MFRISLFQPWTPIRIIDYVSPFLLTSIALTILVIRVMSARGAKVIDTAKWLVWLNSLLMFIAAGLGALWLYSDHFAPGPINRSSLLNFMLPGILSILVGVIIGAIESVLARPLLNPELLKGKRYVYWFDIVILASLEGISMAAIFMLYVIWATG